MSWFVLQVEKSSKLVSCWWIHSSPTPSTAPAKGYVLLLVDHCSSVGQELNPTRPPIEWSSLSRDCPSASSRSQKECLNHLLGRRDGLTTTSFFFSLVKGNLDISNKNFARVNYASKFLSILTSKTEAANWKENYNLWNQESHVAGWRVVPKWLVCL